MGLGSETGKIGPRDVTEVVTRGTQGSTKQRLRKTLWVKGGVRGPWSVGPEKTTTRSLNSTNKDGVLKTRTSRKMNFEGKRVCRGTRL